MWICGKTILMWRVIVINTMKATSHKSQQFKDDQSKNKKNVCVGILDSALTFVRDAVYALCSFWFLSFCTLTSLSFQFRFTFSISISISMDCETIGRNIWIFLVYWFTFCLSLGHKCHRLYGTIDCLLFTWIDFLFFLFSNNHFRHKIISFVVDEFRNGKN